MTASLWEFRVITSERLLSIDEAADLLGVSVRYMRRAVGERRVPYIKVGRYLRFHRADLLAYIETNTVAAVMA